MLQYAKKYCEYLRYNLRIVDKVFSFLYSVFIIVIPSLLLAFNAGIFYLNIASLIVGSIYGFYTLILLFTNGSKKRSITLFYKITRIILLTISLGINIYFVYLAGNNPNGIRLIIIIFSIIFWILNVCSTIIYEIVNSQLKIITAVGLKELEQIPGSRLLGVPKADEEVLNKFLKKAKFAEKENSRFKLKQNVKKKSKTLINNLENGEVKFDDAIKCVLEIDGVKLNKKSYLKAKYFDKLDSKQLKLLIKGGAIKAKIKKIDLSAYIDEIIYENQKDIINFQKFFKDEYLKINSSSQLISVFTSFANILIAAQHIIFLYGFDEIDDVEKVLKEEVSPLKLAISLLIYENCDILLTENILYELSKEQMINVVDGIKGKALKIFNKVNKEKIVAAAAPILKGLTKQFTTPAAKMLVNGANHLPKNENKDEENL